ncbi:MAG: 2Fe-2S iron-sulfur cluster binding domain-containing protein [Candidatus Hydrogenedentes bacterium]|nr:2Fe-2S iron-sulfur cluster binding domain-containing protein [Candidatus Hydrogenedentota bacterium]
MSELVFEGTTYEVPPGNTVLEALEVAGVTIPSSCRSGVCQSCLLRAVEGTPPATAQAGLRDTLRQQGYFLACCCKPDGSLEVVRPNDAGLRHRARVARVRSLNATVAELTLECDAAFEYRPGQFANIALTCGTVRSYSLASVPTEDPHLHMHIARMPGGIVSGWVHDSAKEGDFVDLLGPHGNCFYTVGNFGQTLVLAGTGTGLAPLYGIARDALRHGHTGDIHLFHGSIRQEGLYLVEELRALSHTHSNLHYYPCVLEGPADAQTHVGALDAHVTSTLSTLRGSRVFLCGHPDFVKMMQKKTFLLGAAMKDIFADSFLPAKTVTA